MTRFAAVLWASCLAACAHAPVAHYDAAEVKVFSDPPGARIVDALSNAYMCDAPCSIMVGKGSSGTPTKMTRVDALPVRAQDCRQTIILSSDAVPAQIIFDMKVCPINRSLNGTMNGN